MLLQTIENRRFDTVQIISLGVVTGASLPSSRAVHTHTPMIAILDGDTAATAVAFEETREEPLGFALLVREGMAARCLSALNFIK
nr:hypothetical protein [Oceaniradius stylonematis]